METSGASPVPPRHPELERHVLGAMMLDRDACDTAMSMLAASDFYTGRHKLIFGCIADTHNERQAADQAMVAAELEKRGQLEECGGAIYLAELVGDVPTVANLEHYANEVRSASIKRQAISEATAITRRGYEPGVSHADLIGEWSQALMRLEDQTSGGAGPVSAGDILRGIFDDLDGKAKPMRLGTGLGALDFITRGVGKGELVIVAAQPGGGKTTLCLNVARHMASNKAPVLIHSYEMTKEEIGRSILAAHCRACIHGDGTYEKHYHESVSAGEKAMRAWPLYVDERPLRLSELMASVRSAHRRLGIQAVVVDYLQQVRADKGCDTREQEVASIAYGLKYLAKELRIPIVAPCQLNRAFEDKPSLRNLRESGAIEQAADQVWFLVEGGGDSKTREMLIDVAKNRNGETGGAFVRWQRGWRRFEDECPKNEETNDEA